MVTIFLIKQIWFTNFVINSEFVRKKFNFIRNAMKRFLLLILSVLSVFAAYAGEDTYVKRIDASEGLSHPSITDVLTDKNGSVWIGTRYLLNRFVNSSLVTYDESRLSGTYINLVYEDSAGRLWVATENCLSIYDSYSDSFRPVADGEIYSAVESDDRIIFAGQNLILVFDMSSEEIKTVNTRANKILKCYEVDDGKYLLIDKFSGIYTFDVNSLTVGRLIIPEIQGEYILSSYKGNDGIWLGVYFNGIYRISPDGMILERHLVSDYPDLHMEIILDMVEMDSGLWLATDGGGICVLEDGKVSALETEETPSAITRIYRDSYSNIWIGSVRDGLFGIKPASIRNFSSFGPLGKNTPVILSLCHDENNVWVGTDGDGVYRYNPSDDTFALLPNTSGGIISSICDDGPENLLAYLYCKGLYRINKRNGRMKPITIIDDATTRREIMSGYSMTLNKLDDGRTLVAGENVYVYDSSSGEFTTFLPDFGVTPSELKPFFKTSGYHSVYAYSNSGIYAFDMVRGRIAQLFTPENSGRINAAVYSSGKIWIGTDSGMLSYDEYSRSSTALASGIFRRVTNITLRGDNSLWIIADNSLYSYDTLTGRIETYDESEGFIASEISVSDSKDDLFYFGGASGLTVVPARFSSTVTENPVLRLTNVHVDGKNMRLRKHRRLRLPVSMESASFSFNLSGADPFRRTLLKYSITGRTDISVETYNTTLDIQKIQAGEYTLQASYLQTDGVWSEPQDYLRFTMPDVLWKRNWFISLLLLMLCGVLYLIVLKIRDRADERVQTAISRNKADDVKRRSRFVKGFGAEISGHLAEISSSAHNVLSNESALSEKSRTKLENIFNNSLQIERALSDAIEQEGPVESENVMMTKFAQLVDDNLIDSNLDVSMLVREMGMSRTVLYEKIKEATGLGINEYIQKRRLLLARKQLVESDLSIAEISDNLGYSSPKYFSVVFKNAFGVSPREFKKKITV